jgi:hypothetical protein
MGFAGLKGKQRRRAKAVVLSERVASIEPSSIQVLSPANAGMVELQVCVAAEKMAAVRAARLAYNADILAEAASGQEAAPTRTFDRDEDYLAFLLDRTIQFFMRKYSVDG